MLQAACPLYLKSHSYGEYVFDWAWADAYERNGLAYYPKLLAAVPFTPVPGPRLLALAQEDREVLLQAMQQLAREADLSSAHLLFLDEATGRHARGRLDDAQHGAVPLDQSRAAPRTRTSRSFWQACSATNARRSSRNAGASRKRA